MNIPVELVGGPKDGQVVMLGSQTRVLAVPVKAGFGGEDSEIHYERRMQHGQPVTNKAGNLLFDYRQPVE
jgi:hypothetical protein